MAGDLERRIEDLEARRDVLEFLLGRLEAGIGALGQLLAQLLAKG